MTSIVVAPIENEFNPHVPMYLELKNKFTLPKLYEYNNKVN